MKRILIYTLLLFSSLYVQAQQDLGLHFMRDINQSGLTNPAIFNKYKINISLPSVFANGSNSSFSLNDISRREGSTLLISGEDLIAQLSSTNRLQANVEARPIGVSIQFDQWSFSLSHAIKAGAYINYPRSLVELLWRGNGAMEGTAVSIAPEFDLTAYQETSLGIAYKVNNHLSIGGRFKYLSGLSTIATDQSLATIQTDGTYNQIMAETDFQINSAGIPITIGEGDEFLNIGELSPQGFGKNTGFALDLGATLSVNERLTISASLLDLGAINWKESVSNLTSQGRFEFEGLELEEISSNDGVSFDEFADSIKSIFQFTETNASFSTALPSRFYLSGIYKLNSGIQLGALFYGESFQNQLSPAVAFSARKEFGNVFSTGAVLGIRNKSFNNLGLNMAVRLAGIQLYAMTDNIISAFNPASARTTNIRFGLNLAFGKPKETE